MGRKTNSISLRLKKTNRDYNNCWYGDILYADCFSRSLKVQHYLSLTLKTIGISCPQTSVIGAFKKANFLVCYLDPIKRKRLLDLSSKGFTNSLLSGSSKQGLAKTFTNAKKAQQHLKTLNSSFFSKTHSSFSSSLQSRDGPPLTTVFSFNGHSGGFTSLSQSVLPVYGQQAKVKPISGLKDKMPFYVKTSVKPVMPVSKPLTPRLNYFHQGPLGLEFYQSQILVVNEPCSFHGTRILHFDAFKKTKTQKQTRTFFNKKTFKPSLLVDFSKKNNKKRLANFHKHAKSFSLKTQFFVSLQEKKHRNCEVSERFTFPYSKSLPLKNSEKPPFFLLKKQAETHLRDMPKRQAPLGIDKSFASQPRTTNQDQQDHKFFPYILENTPNTLSPLLKGSLFSDFFYSVKNYTPLFLAFSKRGVIFGKNSGVLYALAYSRYCYLPEIVLSLPSSIVHCDKPNGAPLQLGLRAPKDNTFKVKDAQNTFSACSLYNFYNGFSCFWENPLSVSFYKSSNETSCALFLANCVSYLLEKRILFRSIKRQLLLDLISSKNNPKVPYLQKKQARGQILTLHTLENKKKVTGLRISCSGRVGGRSKKAQRSRKDTLMWGETGLHVFSSQLDFAKTHAETPFGVVGVKVWVKTAICK